MTTPIHQQQFCVGLIAPAIIEPLRYFFSNPDLGTGLVWDSDPAKRTIDINEAYHLDPTPTNPAPQVVVSRGGFSAGRPYGGLSDGLTYENKDFPGRRGEMDSNKVAAYMGQATILVRARSKGVAELITDMVIHFLMWSRPTIMDVMGWKDFASNMTVSDCTSGSADNEGSGSDHYEVQIGVPWIKEESWVTKTSNPGLRKVLIDLRPIPAN